ncbi:MAG: hypothetical protein ACXVB1_18805 [Pseudobdellovibrionaceae bacterium]
MKITLLFLAFIFSSAAFSTEKIHSISNVNGSSVVVEVWGDQRKLLFVNLETAKTQTLPWPEQVKSEEILGGILLSDRLYLISQWTSGGGKMPTVHEYDRSIGSWIQKKQTINCISFDTLEIKSSVLTIHCEADPFKEIAAHDVKIPLTTKSVENFKIVLPLTTSAEGVFAYQLEGSLFSWTALNILKNNKVTKNLSALSLTKAK